MRQIPSLRELRPNPIMEICPSDAAELGITDGQWCEIYNNFGSAKFKAQVVQTMKKGHIEVDHGWWFPEQEPSEPNLFGVWQSNTNKLIPSHHCNALGFGAPYKSACCNVRPLKESYDVDMKAFGEKFSFTPEYVDSIVVKKGE